MLQSQERISRESRKYPSIACPCPIWDFLVISIPLLLEAQVNGRMPKINLPTNGSARNGTSTRVCRRKRSQLSWDSYTAINTQHLDIQYAAVLSLVFGIVMHELYQGESNSSKRNPMWLVPWDFGKLSSRLPPFGESIKTP